MSITTPRQAGSLVAIAMLLSVAWPSAAAAQKSPDPGLSYVYPPVVVAGRTTDVTIAGSDWTPDLQVIVHDPRVTLETVDRPGPLLVPEPPFVVGPKAYSPPPLPREQRARVTVPGDFPTGPVYWQVANANGASQVGVFFVIERPEVIEPADRSREIRLETLPVMVSGRLRRNEEIDRYLFTATRTGAVTCTLWARRIGSNFRGVLEVRDARGKLLAQRTDTTGRDLSLTFGVKQKQRYSVAVRELDFRGHRSYVYRLQVRDGGRVLTGGASVADQRMVFQRDSPARGQSPYGLCHRFSCDVDEVLGASRQRHGVQIERRCEGVGVDEPQGERRVGQGGRPPVSVALWTGSRPG